MARTQCPIFFTLLVTLHLTPVSQSVTQSQFLACVASRLASLLCGALCSLSNSFAIVLLLLLQEPIWKGHISTQVEMPVTNFSNLITCSSFLSGYTCDNWKTCCPAPAIVGWFYETFKFQILHLSSILLPETAGNIAFASLPSNLIPDQLVLREQLMPPPKKDKKWGQMMASDFLFGKEISCGFIIEIHSNHSVRKQLNHQRK